MITSLTRDNGHVGGLYRENQVDAARLATALALLSFNGGYFPDAQRIIAQGLEYKPSSFLANMARLLAEEVLAFYGVGVHTVESAYRATGGE